MFCLSRLPPACRHQRSGQRSLTRMLAHRSSEAAADLARPQTHQQQHNSSSPPKRRRVAWQWQCPACSNKHPTGPRLLLHMHKCCSDLLPSQYDLPAITQLVAQQQQQQQQPDDAYNQRQHSDVDQQLQQVVAAAEQQEHVLRMRALRLRFIDESKLQALAAAADAGGGDEEAAEEDTSVAAAVDVATAAGADGVHPPPPPAAATAATSNTAGNNSQGDNSSSSGTHADAPAAVKKRNKRLRSKGRVPVRTLQEVAQELQLCEARVSKLLERAPRSIRLVADSEPLQVVWEDAHFLAVCKPPGLRSAPIHRFMGGSAVNRMIGYLGGAEPYLLHRLDMDTSGVLLAAKDAATAAAANTQFQAKQVSKAYLALCLGVPQQSSFTVEGPIGQHPGVQVARRVVPDGQPAQTHVQVLSVSTSCPEAAASSPAAPSSTTPSSSDQQPPAQLSWGPAAAADPLERVKGVGCCLVCCRPVTGRTHQIRVHMAHSGHPLLGDDVYGLQGPWIGRQALHAASLTLQHPSTCQPVTFVAPPPDDFAAAAAALGLTIPPLEELAGLSSRQQLS